MMTIYPFMVKPLTHIVDIPEKIGEEKGEETECWRNFRDGPFIVDHLSIIDPMLYLDKITVRIRYTIKSLVTPIKDI